MEKILHQVKSFFKALICFLIACCLLPMVFLSFVCVHYSDELVNYVLSIKYPTLTISKSKKIRTLIDTPRNAGVFHFLLQIKGQCDFEQIKRYYADNLTDARDKAGYLSFPKLRQKLVTCWGHYAWVNDNSSFNINNHVVLSARTYRGRPVNDSNIQDFVSELATKYIPSDLPQWQVIVIPTASTTSNATNTLPEALTENTSLPQTMGDHYYVLVKVHHLIIAEEDDLHISEILMLQENGRKPVIDIDRLEGAMKPQPLSYFVREPIHIRRLINHIGAQIVNYWNAFIYEFESLETPDGYRPVHITNITQLLSVLLIVAVNVCLDYRRTMQMRLKLRRRYNVQKDNYGRVKIFSMLLLKEIDRRNLSLPAAWMAICTSWHPANVAKTWTKFLWRVNINNTVLLPYRIYCELMALRDIVFKGQTHLTHTHIGRISIYLPMILYAQIEFFKIGYEIFKAPVNIYEELFVNPSKEANILQMKSYSGRKIVSFSKSINATELRQRLNFGAEVRESDFILSCLAGALRDYFAMHSNVAPVPKVLNTTCRTIAKGYFTEKAGNKAQNIGGVVFLQLPLQAPGREHARKMHTIVENIRSRQIMIYLASMGQTRFDLLTALVPRVLTKVCLNFFSHNFPVTITEIHGASSEFQTIWGHVVEDVLLFRPPQSKTCLSLNIHRFGDRYRLAIMADTQLGPDHAQISRAFENYIETVSI
ncbi:uncharacterized protein LOC128863572 isoform X1 [Anastrepha ludens]|uniref:uncharacterized protein LOC128863572 isoform X1 n=1 Tax=Anastrepha ludens TaxID=28586 RepID=UPI0023B11488|nr:uncharacterized protein LOC128863572 isoform X1 [Anastrepha ludens]